MMKQRSPTTVRKLAPVPRLIVVYSRMMVPAPISTQVSSPWNLRSCGSPPEDRTVADPDVGAQPDVLLQPGAGPDAAAVSHRHPRADHGPGTDLDPDAQLGAGVDDRGGMDRPGHRSTTRAIISASATTLPSTKATPFIRQVRPRFCSISSSQRSWSPGSTGRRNFTLSRDMK